jgi:2-dehydropantoate 2-reductase
MRVTIFGAGALGSVIGAMMAESQTVTLVCREDHAREINADGLWLDGLEERKAFPLALVDPKGLPVQDLVIVTVKAYDTRTALRSILPILGENTSVMVVQNGLTVLRDVKELAPGALVGMANIGALYMGPGHVRLTGRGELVIGNPDDREDPGVTALESFRSTGIPCRLSNDMTMEVWKKAVISSCINPLTALTRKPNAIIVEDQGINDLANLCFSESFQVGQSSGHLEQDDMNFADVERVAKATAGNRSSMLQDVERTKRTEIENINGEIVRAGTEAGLDVRVNRMMLSLVSALSNKNRRSDDY